MPRPRPVPVFLLALAAALLLNGIGAARVTEAEARYVWLVDDGDRLSTATITQAGRSALISLGTAFERSSQIGEMPVYALALDLWTRLAGDSLLAMRWLSALITLVALALFTRGARRMAHRWRGVALGMALAFVWLSAARHAAPTALLLALVALGVALAGRRWHAPALTLSGVVGLGLGLAGVLTPAPDWSGVIRQINANRTPDEPALVGFAPHTLAGYHVQAAGLADGVAIRIGWRQTPPTDDDLRRYVESVTLPTPAMRPVWLMLPEPSAYRATLEALLSAAGYSETSAVQVGGARLARWSP